MQRRLQKEKEGCFIAVIAYGLLLLGITFLVCAFLACLLLPSIFVCGRKAALHLFRRRRRPNANTTSPRTNAALLLMLGSISLATVTAMIFGLVKVEAELMAIATRTENAVESLQTVSTVPDRLIAVLNKAEVVFASVHNASEGCADSDIVEKIDVTGLIDGLEEALPSISNSGLSELAVTVDHTTDWISVTRGVMKFVVWPMIVLCVVVIMTYVTKGLVRRSTTSFAQTCWSRSFYIRPLSVFLAIGVLASAACSIALSAMSGDFCINPNTHVVNMLWNSDQPAVGELVEYYAMDCSTTNTAVENISTTQDIARQVIQPTLQTLWEATTLCDGIVTSVQAFNASMKQAWSILDEAGRLISCRNINGIYQSVVYDGLCDNLLGKGLLVLLVSCALLAAMLLLLVVQWTRMLRQKEALHNVPVVKSCLEDGETCKPRRGRTIDYERSARTTAYSPRELSPMIRSPGRISPSTRSPSSRKFSPISFRRSTIFTPKRAMSIAPKLSPTKAPVSTLPISRK